MSFGKPCPTAIHTLNTTVTRPRAKRQARDVQGVAVNAVNPKSSKHTIIKVSLDAEAHFFYGCIFLRYSVGDIPVLLLKQAEKYLWSQYESLSAISPTGSVVF